MALFRGIQEYIARDVNNIARVEDEGNIVGIEGNIFLYPPQGHPILYKYPELHTNIILTHLVIYPYTFNVSLIALFSLGI